MTTTNNTTKTVSANVTNTTATQVPTAKVETIRGFVPTASQIPTGAEAIKGLQSILEPSKIYVSVDLGNLYHKYMVENSNLPLPILMAEKKGSGYNGSLVAGMNKPAVARLCVIPEDNTQIEILALSELKDYLKKYPVDDAINQIFLFLMTNCGLCEVIKDIDAAFRTKLFRTVSMKDQFFKLNKSFNESIFEFISKKSLAEEILDSNNNDTLKAIIKEAIKRINEYLRAVIKTTLLYNEQLNREVAEQLHSVEKFKNATVSYK